MAFAGSATSGKGVTASAGTSDATDISARRRHYRGGGGAAAAAAFAGIVGTGLAIAATQNRREYYDAGYGYYDGGPAYYGGPVYYGHPGYYGLPSIECAALSWASPRRLVNATAKIVTVKDESTGRDGRWIFL